MHDVPPSWRLTYILFHVKMYIIYLLSRPSSVAKSIGRALYLFLHSLLLFIFISNPNHFNYYYYYHYYYYYYYYYSTSHHSLSFYNYYYYFIIIIIITIIIIIIIIIIMISESLSYQCIFFYNVIGPFYHGKYGSLL